MFKKYLTNLHKVAKRGDAREESYYPALKTLLEDFAKRSGHTNAQVTVNPKKTEAGNPDFRIWDGIVKITGYIEAKKLGTNLDTIEHSEQLQRYINTFHNVILTNFTEFRLYRNGEFLRRVSIADELVLIRLKEVPPLKAEKDIKNLLTEFFGFSRPRPLTAEMLAEELAKRTEYMRDSVISPELEIEIRKGKGKLYGFYEAFHTHLIAGLKKEQFADLYSQTLTYGLFAARTKAKQSFTRKNAYEYIPKSIGILRDVFSYISLGEPSADLKWIVDEICDILAAVDVKSLLDEFYTKGKGNDPIVHFYETFLAKYDPEKRERRGVYYTPEPVVKYIVNSLSEILKDAFGKEEGFADRSVTVLDPAAGTMTFITEATKKAAEEFTARYGEGGKKQFIKEHILENFYAFELMVAPYAMGHFKMSYILENLGYTLSEDERVKLYLTNTLELKKLEESHFPFAAILSEESRAAGEIKREKPILVILGNPPYSGHSPNVSEEITNLIDDYKYVDDKPLHERNPKWLQDDYVKFIRFAQWKIDRAGKGVLGFITNHSYLDNPTFRGMRQSLMRSFDEIYILNIHGNARKGEKCPDGSKDENLFDIQQGVAIAIFIKHSKSNKTELAKIHYADLYGLREAKGNYLVRNSIKTTDWQQLKPHSPFYFFIPRDERLLTQYEKYPKVTDIFPLHSVGIVTSRDKFVFDFAKKQLKQRIMMFIDDKLTDRILKQTYNLQENRSWKVEQARKTLQREEDIEKYIMRCLYRPFDTKWLFCHDAVIERSRKNVMRHMMARKNLSLITIRRSRSQQEWNYIFVSRIISGSITVTNLDINYVFPLYLYPNSNKEKGENNEISWNNANREPNINLKLVESLSKTYGREPTPEEIFYYIYAVLYSNIYREKYSEFLKIDFPRIPFTADYEIFQKIAQSGERLVKLHLLESRELDPPIAKFPEKGGNRIGKSKSIGRNYVAEERRVYINKERQYFEGITQEAWEYCIGGYQALDSWLKYRKERVLSLDEITQFCKIVTAILKTIEIQKEIDQIFPEITEEIISL